MTTIPSWIGLDGSASVMDRGPGTHKILAIKGEIVTSTVDDTTGKSVSWDKLLRKLQELRPVLMAQGSLVRLKKRGQHYWYLRYYDPDPNSRKQRSLYIGSAENAQHVRQLLEQIRAPGEFLRETLHLADLARHVVGALLRRGERNEPQE